MSPSLSHFAPAMVQVQLKLRPVIKKSENPHFKSTFANLAAILEEALPVLGDHGFALMQFPTTDDRGQLALMSMLIHESGQYVSATMPLMVVKQDPQGEGSAISYGRRYAACAILGIRTADDDGEAAVGRARQPEREVTPPVDPAKTEGWADAGAEAAAHGAVAAQIKQLFALVPEDHPVRSAIRSYRDEHGWPMAAALLTELAVRVAKAHGVASAPAGQEQVESAPPADPAQEAAVPAPGAPSGQSEPPASERLCPWCDEVVVGPKVITGGSGKDDPIAYWHKDHYEKMQAEQAPPPEEEG
jgi:hypothetical protein